MQTATRERLPDTRTSVTHKFSVAGHEGYITVGLYEDGRPGELFLKIAKQGSTMSGLLDCIGILTSLALQHGVPLEAIVSKLEHTRFEPSGFSKNPDIGDCSSLVDYIARWLGQVFDQDKAGQRGSDIADEPPPGESDEKGEAA